MAKDRTDAEKAARKAEKKEKKRKDREHDAVADAEPAKKERKEKKRKASEDLKLDHDGDTQIALVKSEKEGENGEEVKSDALVVKPPLGALVPFGDPLCDEKGQKKVFKTVKKAAKNRTLKRGVKECVKSIRKSPLAAPTTDPNKLPNGIVIMAADISPMDVISHIPVLCEDHNIPYVYVPSRAELGAAGSTKRATSVVLILPKIGKKAEDADGEKEWEEAYKDLHKFALKMGQHIKV